MGAVQKFLTLSGALGPQPLLFLQLPEHLLIILINVFGNNLGSSSPNSFLIKSFLSILCLEYDETIDEDNTEDDEEEAVFRGNKLYPNVPSVSSSGSLGLQRSHPPILLMALNLTQANALKCTRTPISYILYVL